MPERPGAGGRRGQRSVKMTHEGADFRRVLELCDELEGLKRPPADRERSSEHGGDEPAGEKRRKLGELAGRTEKAFGRGALAELASNFELSGEELLLVALLFSRRIRKGSKGLAGREILSMLYENAFDMVTGMGILDPQANLRRAGIIIASEPFREDVFDLDFRLSDEMFYVMLGEIGREAGLPSGRGERKGFSYAREHLVEMGRLTTLYRKRAAALFPVEAQDFFAIDGEIALDEVDFRIEMVWAEIEQRLLLTPDYEKFPLVRLERRYALSREELVVVVSLFFVELVSPAPYLMVGDLVKLVSRNEEDLMASRLLLTPEAPLVKSGLVILDEEHSVHNKLTTFDAYLADWVVERLAGPGRDSSAITADMQIDVHEFLKGLSKSPRHD